ncbi:non-histone protein [Sporothrix epigloea]|uniref:Non-histone protein n=1 Tax=Sporothrix epigloea TaxID=1892477 RepID=A0ABP0D8E9_9PEZI
MAPATSPSATTLPPSVEEAYRRKCVHLKKRMADVEEANDAARVRIARLKRQVEKQRLERAFLLEQLAKRTSTNVEDSDGSPSPPATPKDKPLRTKRGHRKSSAAEGSGAPGSTFITQSLDPLSPASDVFTSQSQPIPFSTASRRGGRKSKSTKDLDDAASVSGKAARGDNDDDEDKEDKGSSRAGSKRSTVKAFELYCEEMRPALAEKNKVDKKKSASGDDGGDVDMEDAYADEEEDDETAEPDVDAALARAWMEMEQAEKDEYEARAAQEQAKYEKAKDESRQRKKKAKEGNLLETKQETEAAGDDEADERDAKAVEGAAAKTGKPGPGKLKDRQDSEMADTVVAASNSKDD